MSRRESVCDPFSWKFAILFHITIADGFACGNNPGSRNPEFAIEVSFKREKDKKSNNTFYRI